MSLSVIIVAAGSSVRMGFDKLAAPLAGRPVLQRTLDVFLNDPEVCEIIVVCPPQRFATLETGHAGISVRRADGGPERQHSVANGLAALAARIRYVAIHDGARPLLDPEELGRCLLAAVADGAAALARRVTETLKRSDAASLCTDSVSREHLWLMETPQVFAVPLIREAYAAVLARGVTVTDEVSAVQALQRPVRFIESLHPNPKITRPADISLAEAILAKR